MREVTARYIHILTLPMRFWQRIPQRTRPLFIAATAVVGIIVMLGLYAGSSLWAINDARRAFRALEEELTQLSAVDLLQVGTYSSLEGRFRKAEETAGRVRSRLRPLGLFKPVFPIWLKQVMR